MPLVGARHSNAGLYQIALHTTLIKQFSAGTADVHVLSNHGLRQEVRYGNGEAYQHSYFGFGYGDHVKLEHRLWRRISVLRFNQRRIDEGKNK